MDTQVNLYVEHLRAPSTSVTRTGKEMNVQASISVSHGTTVADLKKAFESVPDEAKVSIATFKGDQREPSYSTITFRWNI